MHSTINFWYFVTFLHASTVLWMHKNMYLECMYLCIWPFVLGLCTITAFKSVEIIIITLIKRPPTFQPKHGQVAVFQETSTIIDVWKTLTLDVWGEEVGFLSINGFYNYFYVLLHQTLWTVIGLMETVIRCLNPIPRINFIIQKWGRFKTKGYQVLNWAKYSLTSNLNIYVFSSGQELPSQIWL